MPELDGKQGPDLHAQRVTRVLDVAQHSGDGHDGQTYPEKVEKAMEVTVVAVGVEVGHSAGEFDRREDAPRLLARRREALNRGRRVGGDGRGLATI